MAVFDDCEAKLGEPGVLINDTGVRSSQTSKAGMTAQRISKLLPINVTGAFIDNAGGV